ncbi:G-box-binding factor 1-like [Corylus avellana]|uniref:G-box-binding factor 1-like n=1 Tax=Corylus avellana TaxID=13451 RepID=UPI00286D5ECB|nr:G-box-binding factor 1-like [Corylus avellana]
MKQLDGDRGREHTPPKPSKPASSVQEIPTTPYPDWSSSMQAYYGPRAMPPPFFPSTIASPTPHPYIWGSQHPLIPPYGTPIPYPGLYRPWGVYAHPNMTTVQKMMALHKVLKVVLRVHQAIRIMRILLEVRREVFTKGLQMESMHKVTLLGPLLKLQYLRSLSLYLKLI